MFSITPKPWFVPETEIQPHKPNSPDFGPDPARRDGSAYCTPVDLRSTDGSLAPSALSIPGTIRAKNSRYNVRTTEQMTHARKIPSPFVERYCVAGQQKKTILA